MFSTYLRLYHHILYSYLVYLWQDLESELDEKNSSMQSDISIVVGKNVVGLLKRERPASVRLCKGVGVGIFFLQLLFLAVRQFRGIWPAVSVSKASMTSACRDPLQLHHRFTVASTRPIRRSNVPESTVRDSESASRWKHEISSPLTSRSHRSWFR
jgi:hypothetical protein